jgi:DHA2 family multidrug resistance protein
MRPLIGLLGVVVAAISSEFNDQVSSIALPDTAGGLGFSHDPGTWFGSLYVTAEIVGMAISPWLLVTFTLRHFTLLVILLNAISSVLIPFSPDQPALLALRVAQGLSGGLTIPLLMTTALRVLDPPIRLYGLSVYAVTATFVPAVAATVAAAWTDLVGWQFVFLESVPLCAVAAVLVWYGVPQDEPHYDRFRVFDWRGAVLILVGLGSFSTMLQQGDRLDWFNSPLICVLALISVVAIPLLIVNEWFHKVPLLKLQLLGRRNIAYGVIALFIFLLIGLSGSVLPNTFLEQVQGFRPEQLYPLTLAIALAQLLMLPALAWLLDFPAVDARVVSFIGLMLILTACLTSSFITGDWFVASLWTSEALQAVGQPMVVVPLLLMCTNSVQRPDEAPFLSALVNTPRAISEAVGVWLIQLIQRWRGGLHYNRIADQVGQERLSLIQAPAIDPRYPPPLLPDGHSRAPGSLAAFAHAVQQQAQILTISDAFLVSAALTAALMVIVLVLPERTLPPRLQFAKK